MYGIMTNSLSMMHFFSQKIIEILEKHFGNNAIFIFENSPLIGYLNTKILDTGRLIKNKNLR